MATRILVIEDNQANLELMTYLLKAFGYAVTSANDGEEGLAAVRRELPELIVCDVHLPRMDGREVVQQLKSDSVFCRIPIVAVTALAMVGDRDRMLAAGFDGYIAKPIVPESFVKQVEFFLSPKQRARPMAPAEAVQAHMPAASPTTILVVDNTTDNIELARVSLEPFGYRVITSHSVAGGLELAHQSPPDLILSDVHMPGEDGFTFIKAVKADPRLNMIPFVFLSNTSAREKELAKALALGATKFIVRPIELKDFLAEIEACLSQPRLAKHATILIVDDSPVNLSLMRSTFEPLGYEVIATHSVQQGLALAAEYPPDVIVSDMHMPGASGYDFLIAAKCDANLTGIPFVIISSTSVSDRERRDCLAAGADKFITRPIEPQELLAHIGDCLRREES
jgi:two-component system cell cycle response regulator